jgi:hypothetical protein
MMEALRKFIHRLHGEDYSWLPSHANPNSLFYLGWV